MAIEDKVVTGISDSEYRATEAVTASGFLELLKSPLHWRAHRQQKTESPTADDSRSKAKGRLFHQLALEPEKGLEEYAIEEDDNPNRKAGPYQAFKKKAIAEGKAIVAKPDMEYAKLMADKVLALVPSGGKAEAMLCATAHGIDIRCRFDKVVGDDCVSLKSTASLPDYDHQYNNLKEYWKDVFYAYVVAAACGKPVFQRHIVIENIPPHDTAWRWFPVDADNTTALEFMFGVIDDKLKGLKQCMDTGLWYGVDADNAKGRALRLEKWALDKVGRAQ